MDILFMQRALALANLGMGNVSPNPLVGCVIVHQNRIIGEGYHQKYGEAHAEVNAIRSVENKDIVSEATFYVTLEPCSHYGKTPPCADLLIEYRPQKVYIATTDPNPLVAGKGIEKLRRAGIMVEVGLCGDEARWQNRKFFHYITQQTPYIILKWAETADGFIARPNYDSKWISNATSRMLVHKWRSEEDAILVGKHTALHDNPHLNVRDWTGRNPIRMVIDSHLNLPSLLNLFDDTQPTWCFNLLKNEEKGNTTFIQIEGKNSIQEILDSAYQRKIQSILIEGGTHTLYRFIQENKWNEARIFKAKSCFGEGIRAPLLHGKLIERIDIEGDELSLLVNTSISELSKHHR